MTTRNRKASLKERFRIMAQYYGLISTAAYHAWFVLRAVLKNNPYSLKIVCATSLAILCQYIGHKRAIKVAHT